MDKTPTIIMPQPNVVLIILSPQTVYCIHSMAWSKHGILTWHSKLINKIQVYVIAYTGCLKKLALIWFTKSKYAICLDLYLPGTCSSQECIQQTTQHLTKLIYCHHCLCFWSLIANLRFLTTTLCGHWFQSERVASMLDWSASGC